MMKKKINNSMKIAPGQSMKNVTIKNIYKILYNFFLKLDKRYGDMRVDNLMPIISEERVFDNTNLL